MDYEKKYKQLHTLISDLYPFMSEYCKEKVEGFFPELKESKDEKSKKWILEYLYDGLRKSDEQFKDHFKAAIAWLEKQGQKTHQTPQWMIDFLDENRVNFAYTMEDYDEQREVEGKLLAIISWLEKQNGTNVFDVPKISIKDAVEVTSRMQYIEDDMKPIADFVIDYANWDLHKDEWNQPTLTVPLFRVLDALIQRGKHYCECSQNSEKQDEQIPSWSEEDKEMIDKIIDYMQPMPIFFESTKGKSGKEYTKKFVKDATKWLKSLKKRIGG